MDVSSHWLPGDITVFSLLKQGHSTYTVNVQRGRRPELEKRCERCETVGGEKQTKGVNHLPVDPPKIDVKGTRPSKNRGHRHHKQEDQERGFSLWWSEVNQTTPPP